MLGACSTSPAPGSSSGQASMLKVAFKQGGTYRYHYSSHLDGSMTMGQVLSLPVKADGSADATWKVVSVDASGDSTVDLTLSNLKTTFTGSLLPGSTTTTTTTTTTQHFQFTVAPTGEIVPGSGPSVPLSAMPLGQGLGPPGTDQFLATLPGRPVKPGDTWTKTFTRLNPLGQGSVTYTTQNRFVRYENLKSGRAAVIETRTEVPLDVTVDLQGLVRGTGAPPSPSPTAFTVHLQGTSSTVSTTWFDATTDQVERMITVDTSDVTTSFTGASGAPPFPLPSLPPGLLPGSPGPVGPGVLAPQHFTGRQTIELDLLT
jgi:hypothetical protein